MTNPIRAEVAVCFACGALPCDQAHKPMQQMQHTDDINDLILLEMARDELAAENQALRERAEAAENERAEQWRQRREAEEARDTALAISDAARRAEAAAWNDAIEAAANCAWEEWNHKDAEVSPDYQADRIRALRRSAPTEGEA